jgi:hypothetical protein
MYSVEVEDASAEESSSWVSSLIVSLVSMAFSAAIMAIAN